MKILLTFAVLITSLSCFCDEQSLRKEVERLAKRHSAIEEKKNRDAMLGFIQEKTSLNLSGKKVEFKKVECRHSTPFSPRGREEVDGVLIDEVLFLVKERQVNPDMSYGADILLAWLSYDNFTTMVVVRNPESLNYLFEQVKPQAQNTKVK